LLSGGQQAQDRMRAEADQQAAIDAARRMTDFDQSAPNTFNQEEAIKIASARPEFNQSWSNQVPVKPNVAARAVAPVQQRAPIDLTSGQAARPQAGGLANLFSGKDYQSKGGELRQDGRINWGDSDSAADFFRASKALQETPDASGMATGGAAKPHKDAALHKALDIIAHMLGRH